MTQKSLTGRLLEKIQTGKGRLAAAMICYAILLAIALYTLLPARSQQERFIVGAVVAVFVLLAVKTMAHSEDDGSE
jgi:uncharacterized BrkB/YihY/UPF0761 family membrane protein